MTTRYKTQYPGVRYREHPTKKHGKNYDRYFIIRYKINGKPKEEGLGWSSDGWNAQKAANLRAELLENQRRGEGPLSLAEKREEALKEREEIQAQKEKEKIENITFKKVVDRYIEWAKRNKGDWQHDYNRLYYGVVPILGNMRIKDIQSAHIEKLKNDRLDKGYSAATIRHFLQVTRATINFAIRNDYFEGKNPVQNVKFPKQDNKRRRFLSYEEANTLLKALKERSQDMHDMALLSLHTGMRTGEIFDLCFHDIDWENEIIHIMDAKNQESRPAYMTRAVKEMLERRKETIDNVLVFPSRDGDRIKKLSCSFPKTVKELGFNKGIEDERQKVVFHTLRHTFASWLAMQGEPLLTIKELLGHKSVEMTMRYAHLIPDQKRAAIGKMEQKANGKVVDMEEVRQKKSG